LQITAADNQFMAARRAFHLTAAIEKQSIGDLCTSVGSTAIPTGVVGRGEKITTDECQCRQCFFSIRHG